MHFSIPDTQDFKDNSGNVYKGYKIHINGVFHCTVRFRQLLSLHEQLKKEFGSNELPIFPSKKIFPLTAGQTEERRVQLEKYIQTVGQISKIANSEIFNGFLLSAQQETICEKHEELTLNVHLPNNYHIPLQVYTTDRSDQVLQKACKHLNLPEHFMQYFALYLIKKNDNGELRKLQNFESPYMSSKNLDVRIVIRKSYWDLAYDFELMKDPVALHLLYVQTISDVERGWILCDKETMRRLSHLQARGEKLEYVEIARTLKFYGYIQFKPCTCDYPKPETLVLISIGNQELNMRVSQHREVREGSFRVTRMRCWRITVLHDSGGSSSSTSMAGVPAEQVNLELSFEYLIARDTLKWITVSSPQAILMSICLQSMVDELLLKKNGVTRPASHAEGNAGWSYLRRDGSSLIHGGRTDGRVNSSTEPFSVKRLREKFSSVLFKSGKDFVENHAFEGIGDDDL